jgi:hypothetical protein
LIAVAISCRYNGIQKIQAPGFFALTLFELYTVFATPPTSTPLSDAPFLVLCRHV